MLSFEVEHGALKDKEVPHDGCGEDKEGEHDDGDEDIEARAVDGFEPVEDKENNEADVARGEDGVVERVRGHKSKLYYSKSACTGLLLLNVLIWNETDICSRKFKVFPR